jgi:dipeptidyl-peptidase-4
MRIRKSIVPIAVIAAVPGVLVAQDRLKTMPGYSDYQRVAPQIQTAIVSGALAATWVDDGRAIEYGRDGRRYRFDVATRRITEPAQAASAPARSGRGRSPADAPERGRQFASALSPDGRLNAFYRDRNLWLSGPDGTNEAAVTTDGSTEARIKYGTASWVYGEELEQRTAMWWSPDSRKLAYYRFDERPVPDYFVALNQTLLQDTVDTEAYPKSGVSNPVVDVFVYDVAARQSVRIDVRDGRPFDNTVVGHYVYHVMWSPDGSELLFFRTNRRQNVMEVVAANPATGATRVILREEWPTGWLNEDPRLVFLRDGRRFIWESQRNGWDNFYLYDLSGKLIAPLTSHTSFEVSTLVKIDEEAGVLFYTARDGDNPLKMQLHRVGLDGTGDRRLTDPMFHHSVGQCLTGAGPRLGQYAPPLPCGISPDGKYAIDVYQTHDSPPATRIIDATSGSVVAPVVSSDTTKFTAIGLKKAEMFTYTAADGKTMLRGLIQFPSTFNPGRKYPVLVSTYGGPEFANLTSRETFVTPSALAEYGFLVVNLDSRAVPGMGKRQLDSLYLKLGQTEIDDMAEGVKALANRPYVDRTRVGIFGTSYGGYVAAMELVRHPELFAAAAASSPPTDWRNYDSIYTERYMWIPQENQAGYDAASVLTHVDALKGRLLIYYGTADNNVHPSNSLQLIQTLQALGKSFDLQIGPDQEHSEMNRDRMMEFFIENLVTRP